ncbi:MAG: sigma-70 family RNA polymerase sigma factor [Patescibacteria group bacterium]|nr:sigma-70 family RNA polymerase sigma factor [Patescibacteria group bacterium]
MITRTRKLEYFSCYSHSDLLELISSAQNGNRESANCLIKIYTGMVAAIAERFEVYGYETEDFISAGCEGILRAIEKFDPHRHFKIPAFFTKSARNKMIDLYRKAKNENKWIEFVQYEDILAKADKDIVSGSLTERITQENRRYFLNNMGVSDEKIDFLLTASAEELSTKVGISLRQAKIFSLWLSGEKYWQIARCLYGVDSDTKIKANLCKTKKQIRQWVFREFL